MKKIIVTVALICGLFSSCILSPNEIKTNSDGLYVFQMKDITFIYNPDNEYKRDSRQNIELIPYELKIIKQVNGCTRVVVRRYDDCCKNIIIDQYLCGPGAISYTLICRQLEITCWEDGCPQNGPKYWNFE